MANPPGMRRPVGVGSDLVACAVVSVAEPDIPALRRSPGTLGDRPVAQGVVKHADEQTVVGLSAVLTAIARGGLDPAGFADWGVVAAPSFLGRDAFDVAFPQFLAEGAWGVSPLLISSHSLHAVSGIISQAIKAHGPNLGVGGTPGDEEQALLAAAVMLAEGSAAGVWVVLTGWEPGWKGHSDGDPPRACGAVALALRAPRPGWLGPRLRIAPGAIRVEPRSWRVDEGESLHNAPHWLAMVSNDEAKGLSHDGT